MPQQATVPALLEVSELERQEENQFPAIEETERNLLMRAKDLFDKGFPDHSLLDIWNASIHNLRRRIELYGIDLFLSSIKDEPGRKKHDPDGESISERWQGVDDLVLIIGATRLGVLNKKAGKALEMINWTRNHASPAHPSDNNVVNDDVIAIALILQTNLFKIDMPDPGHSPSGLFDPIKNSIIDPEHLEELGAQIRSYTQADIKNDFRIHVRCCI